MESGDCMCAKEEFDAKEAQEMIDLWLKDDAPEWIRTKMMSILYEQWQNKNIRRFAQPDLHD